MRRISAQTALIAVALLVGCRTIPSDPSTEFPAFPAVPELSSLAEPYNPNNFDTAKIMDAINNPKPDLVTISSHRGLHALVDGSYPRVPENSLQAIGLAAQAGLEMVEIDVKLTSDGVPILSHDTTWGRETNYNNGTDTFDPFNTPNSYDDSLNPPVDSLSLSAAKRLRLRDTISLQTYPESEYVSSLQDALNFMTQNRIAMVLSLDIRDPRTAAAAWVVIANSRDYLGRSYAASTLFKVVAKAFRTPADFKSNFSFGPGYQAVNYWPVYNTSDIAPDVFGDEQSLILHLRNFQSDPTIKVSAVEIQMKQTPGILNLLLENARENPFTGRAQSVTVFSPYVDYYAPGDTAKTDPLFFRTNGYCCVRLSDFYYNGAPNGQPSDTADNRGSFSFVDGTGFNSVTTDNAATYAAQLRGRGKRNISYMQGSPTPPEPPLDPLPAPTPGRTSVRKPDPSVIQVTNAYYSVEQVNNNSIAVRSAGSLEGLGSASPVVIWSDPSMNDVWAPEIVRIAGRYYVYFAAVAAGAQRHRTYVIESRLPDSGYIGAKELALPDNKWAIDGTTFVFYNQRYFVWSGWEGDTDGEQNLYIARMSDPTTVTGPRYIISQPREGWERLVGNPFINEAPQPIKDPNGQLHIVYSANGSWSDQYCLGDLRLRVGGDPTYVWDWYKSSGCLFGANGGNMMKDWYPTRDANGPGHNTFALLDGDINNSPNSAYPATHRQMYHAVPKGMNYKWDNRVRYIGAFTWYNNINYSRGGANAGINTGYSPMFFEDPAYVPNPPPQGPGAGSGPTSPGQTGIRNADPSVIRVGGTYNSVEAVANADGRRNIYSRAASSPDGLAAAPPRLIWASPKNMPNIWAPELVKDPDANVYYVFFASGDGGSGQRMYYSVSESPDRNFTDPRPLRLPNDKWAVDLTMFKFGSQYYFVWSGWEGDTNVEQNLYIAKVSIEALGTAVNFTTGPRYIISQPREGWERVVGNPMINESPEAIKDPSGQLHIVYSANGSWGDQYCLGDLRLRAGGDPTYVWDWFKSNGCLFGSNRGTMMVGWDPTLFVNGPGHNTFVLENGDINTSPPAGRNFPMLYHAVPRGEPYTWANRMWFVGGFMWWGNCAYSRGGANAGTNTGWSLKFYEDRNFAGGGNGGNC